MIVSPNDTKFTFRRMQIPDIDACISVRTQTRENCWSREALTAAGITCETVATRLNTTHHGWVCEGDGQIVGFSMGDSSNGELWGVAVLPQYEGKGIGKRLTEAVQRWLADSGWKEIWLWTSPVMTTRAYHLYRRLGWRDCGIVNGQRIMRYCPRTSTAGTEQVLHDGVELLSRINGQEWLSSWHAPTRVPDGARHGATGICVTPEGSVVLVSSDGTRWELPGGRPEGGEDWEQTLQREVREEACAKVLAARLLGFYRGRCIKGHQEGTVLIRAIWRAEVALELWKPQFEMRQRKVVAASEVLTHFAADDGHLPAYRRAMLESGLHIPDTFLRR